MQNKGLTNYIHILNKIQVIIEGETGSYKSLNVEIIGDIISHEKEESEINKQPYIK